MKNSIKTILLTLLVVLSAIVGTACSDNGNNNGNVTSPTHSEAPATDTKSQAVTNITESSASPETTGEGIVGLWTEAKYSEDTELGKGAVTVKIKVVAEDKSVTFTVHTDKDTLGAALLETELVQGDESEYGLFIKFVNGIEADYDKDKAYWAISKNGEYLMTGADSTAIADGENYELTYTKG